MVFVIVAERDRTGGVKSTTTAVIVGNVAARVVSSV
jgi:hypothetical protein